MFILSILAGQYGVLVSLYSRLGGHVLKWSNLMGQKWGAATLPLVHDGQFYNTEMKVGIQPFIFNIEIFYVNENDQSRIP